MRNIVKWLKSVFRFFEEWAEAEEHDYYHGPHWSTKLQRRSAERQETRRRSYRSRGSGIGRGPDVHEDWS